MQYCKGTSATLSQPGIAHYFSWLRENFLVALGQDIIYRLLAQWSMLVSWCIEFWKDFIKYWWSFQYIFLHDVISSIFLLSDPAILSTQSKVFIKHLEFSLLCTASNQSSDVALSVSPVKWMKYYSYFFDRLISLAIAFLDRHPFWTKNFTVANIGTFVFHCVYKPKMITNS